MQTVSSVVKMVMNIWWKAIFFCCVPLPIACTLYSETIIVKDNMYSPSYLDMFNHTISSIIQQHVVNTTTGYFQSVKWWYKHVVYLQRGSLLVSMVGRYLYSKVLVYPGVALDSLENGWHIYTVHCRPCKSHGILYGCNVSKIHIYIL